MKNKKATMEGLTVIHHYQDDVTVDDFDRVDQALATTYYKKNGLNHIHKYMVACTWVNEVETCKTLEEARKIRERFIENAGGATSVFISEVLESTEVY